MQKPAWTQRFRSIVFEGPIGVGKSSLARKFAERFGYTPLLEAPQDNPFLERFYKDSARYALPTQLFFLFQRVDQLREIAQLDLFSEHMVSDFMIEKDRLFALLTLTEDEQQLYQKMFESLRPQVSAPDLVVLLQASPTSLIERIQQRGIAMEQNMSEEYLTQLSEAYTRFFHQYEEAPILIVNTASLNPIDREEDFEALVGQIANFRGRRAYFNLAG
ncbi:MAG: deoxynucleoside kinase [Burkholderiaceae bacterium]|jgi:deoxyguanosine kinase|nr:deoxynucleoside kinase [Burkholderiales bacterium LSUCC0115]NBT73085.1 deoxynucleoside kinase [Betaproteobacteria bacterium]